MLAAVCAEGFTTITNAAREPEIVDLGNFLNCMGAKVRGMGGSVIKIEGGEQASRCGVYDNARPYCCRNISGRICDYGRRDMS